LVNLLAMPDYPVPKPKISSLPDSSSGGESDLGELAALFAAHGGGGLSAEVSADLALEIVLNEIVEQACLTTGATGAAIVLLRDGEMVCRASNGVNAPELGAPLGSQSGLTAECIRTRTVQHCDDAQSDPRADAEASQRLGVRSVMILPLVRKGEMAGVLEVFSPLPGAFGDRDERTLEALAGRILQNLERASEPLSLSSSSSAASRGAATSAGARSVAEESAPVEPALPRAQDVEELRAGLAMRQDEVPLEISEGSTRTKFDIVSLALGTAVLVSAVLLVTLIGIRMSGRRAVRGHAVKPASGAVLSPRAAPSVAEAAGSGPARGDGATVVSAPGSSGTGNSRDLSSETKNASAAESKDAGAKGSVATGSVPPRSVPPPGSLLVYENGKEVFRMLPAEEAAASGEVRRASEGKPAGVVELAPEAAEGEVVRRVEPEYPEEARQQRVQGAVVLEVRIGRDGAVQDVKLVSGQDVLANAAIAAVKQWAFKPRVVQGQPVEMQTTIILNFRLPR
jgi:TonB family protein